MNICFICNTYQYKYFLASHREFLICSGHQVTLLNLGDGSLSQRRGPFSVIKGTLRLLKLRFLGQADVVVTFGVQAGLVATIYRIMSLGRCRTIIWVTGFSWETVRGFARFVRRGVDHLNICVASQVLTDSMWQKRSILSQFGIEARILHNGSVCGARSIERSGPDHLVHYGAQKKFAVVGRLCEEKGVLWLARALKSQTFVVDFFGHLEFENRTDELEFQEILRKNDFLRYRGVSPFVDIAKSHYAVLAPSFREGLPMSIVEAQSYGMAVIARDIEGHREVLVRTNKMNLFRSECELISIIRGLKLQEVETKKISLENNARYSESAVHEDFLRVLNYD